MDVCTTWELNNIVSNLKYIDRDTKEQQRLIAYLIAKSNFKGIKKIGDFYPLPWDKGGEEYVERMSLEELAKIFKF